MNSSPRLIRDSLLLFLWGGFVLWLDLSKQLSTFLHPSLQPYTVAAGILLIVLALFSLRGVLMKQKESGADSHDHHHEHSCCHEHDHQKQENDHVHEEHDSHHGSEGAKLVPIIFKTLVLLLPLVVVLFGQNNHYTMSTINNRGVVLDISKLPAAKASESTALLPKTIASDHAAPAASAAMPIQVIDLLYAVQMPTYREDFEEKQVELIGQFVPLTTGNPKGNRFQAIRLFITCCAADAKPVGAIVQYDKPLKVSEMGWVKITGVPTFPMEGGRRTAVLVASKVEECPAPSEPFVY
jgi:uncharacterized repeat protein (TIGR03943 family)